jgi:hypothetical protein
VSGVRPAVMAGPLNAPTGYKGYKLVTGKALQGKGYTSYSGYTPKTARRAKWVKPLRVS